MSDSLTNNQCIIRNLLNEAFALSFLDMEIERMYTSDQKESKIDEGADEMSNHFEQIRVSVDGHSSLR